MDTGTYQKRLRPFFDLGQSCRGGLRRSAAVRKPRWFRALRLRSSHARRLSKASALRRRAFETCLPGVELEPTGHRATIATDLSAGAAHGLKLSLQTATPDAHRPRAARSGLALRKPPRGKTNDPGRCNSFHHKCILPAGKPLSGSRISTIPLPLHLETSTSRAIRLSYIAHTYRVRGVEEADSPSCEPN